jgi:hypothetical protein
MDTNSVVIAILFGNVAVFAGAVGWWVSSLRSRHRELMAKIEAQSKMLEELKPKRHPHNQSVNMDNFVARLNRETMDQQALLKFMTDTLELARALRADPNYRSERD